MVEDSFSSRRRRDRSLIIAEILVVAKERALKTQIMYKANLSFAQLKEYLSLLLNLNLLKAVKMSEKTIYETTDKGLRYLQSYREIRELLTKGKENNRKDANSLHLVKRGTRVLLL